MSFDLLPWHWYSLGLVLVILEMFLASFVIIWLGFGALLVGVLLWLLPDISQAWQLMAWSVFSLIFAAIWFFVFNPMIKDRTKAGRAKEAVSGEIGQVIKAPIEGKRGTIRFTTPLLGNDEWTFICDEDVVIGDRAFVKDVSGNTLIVGKYQTATS